MQEPLGTSPWPDTLTRALTEVVVDRGKHVTHGGRHGQTWRRHWADMGQTGCRYVIHKGQTCDGQGADRFPDGQQGRAQ